MKTLRFLQTLLVACCASFAARAQVQVVVAVKPPYSAQVKDYILDGSNLLITLINASGAVQKVRLIPSLTGNNGVKVQVREDFMPASPINLAPGETKLLTGAALKAANSNISDGDVQRQGLSQSLLIQTGTLPEGTYQLCVKALPYDNVAGVALGTSGCASLFIQQYDPPIVMNPVNASTVKPQTPQLIPFSWTPSGTPGKTRYSLRLVDMTATNLFNPNDAFLEPAVVPTFKQDNILSNSYIYDAGKPKLLEGHQYAVMVVASDPQGKTQFKNSGRSQVTTFTYKTTGAPKFDGPGNFVSADSAPSQPDPQAGLCAASTLWQGTLNKTFNAGVTSGTDIAVGKFVMKETQLSKTGGGYDGTGEILIPFIGARVKVEFKGIKINGENRMYEGAITGKVTNTEVISDEMRNSKIGLLEKVPDMDALLVYLEDGVRAVNKAKPKQLPMDLPLHFDKDEFTIGIVGMIFEPTEAYANELLNTPIPQAIGNEYLLLAAKGIPIQPGGYGTSTIKLALAKDASVALSDKATLTFKGGASSTFATIDCSGFKSLTLNGAWTLPRTAALPVDHKYAVIADESVKVKVPFLVQAATTMDDILLDNLGFSHRFVLPQAQDFVIAVNGATLDFSDTKNGAEFKTAYPQKAADNTWKGLFIKSGSLAFPGYLTKNGNRIAVGTKHALIDKQGFSGNLIAAGQPLASGSAAGLPIELDSVRLTITNNNLTGGGLGGSLTLPLGTEATVGYKASISSGGQEGATVVFKVITKDEIDANLFLAKITLGANSTIEMKKQAGVFQAAALLHGNLSIDFAKKPASGSNVGKLSIPSLTFEGLSIVAKEDEPVAFDLASIEMQGKAQAKIAGAFELNILNIAFQKSQDNKMAGLGVAMGLTLFGGEAASQNGAGATTGITFWAERSGNRYVYKSANLDSIVITNASLGVATVNGRINIYNADSTFGNGFRGALNATLRGIGASLGVTIQFGRTLMSKGDFKYWYFDAMVDAGNTGIPIPGTVASIYGFGGGAWCNMNRTAGDTVLKPGQFSQKPKGGGAPTLSGAAFVPQKNIAGFKAAVLFGITGAKEAFNGDLTFSMTLKTDNLAVDNVYLKGNGYLMQTPTPGAARDPNKAFLWCAAEIGFEAEPRKLYGSFDAHLNVLELVKGGGKMAFEFDMPDKYDAANRWYIKVGEWTKSNPFIDDARLNAQVGFESKVATLMADFRGYFMVGNNLPDGLPPLPEYIYQYVKDDGVQKKAPLPSSVGNAENLAIALGAGIKVTAGFDFGVVDANLAAEAAFDVLLADVDATCDGKPAGFEGWYAQGQAYAYVRGAAHLFRKITVADLVAGAILQIKLPNPSWVRGDIIVYIDIFGVDAGDYHGTFERGKLCENMKTEFKPFQYVDLIRSVTPSHTATKVSPFTGIDVKLGLDWDQIYPPHLHAYNAYTGLPEMFSTDYSFALKTADGEVVPCTITHVGGKSPSKHIRMYPLSTLHANKKYKVYAHGEIRAPDNKKGYGEYLQHEENVVTEFTTGDLPKDFGIAQVRFCYPFPGQRYLMKQDGKGNQQKGRIELMQDMGYLFNVPGTITVVRIVDVKTNEAWEIPLDDGFELVNGKTYTTVSYTLPANLKNSAVYHLALIRKPVGNIPMKVLWTGYSFRTSKYNTMVEKMAKYSLKKVGYTWGTQAGYSYTAGGTTKSDYNPFNNGVLMLQGSEPLEAYEVYTFNTNLVGETTAEGQLITGWEPSNFLWDQYSKYYYSMPISNSEREFLAKLVPGGTNPWIVRPPFFPFYGKPAKAFSGDAPANVFWMKNVASFEPMMKSFKYLGANESLVAPEMPLTEAEVAAARAGNSGGGYQPVGGLQTANHQGYYALMDYNPQIGALDKVALDQRWLNLAKSKDANTLWTTWQILQKLGDPKYPVGNHTINLRVIGQAGSHGATLEKPLQYNYKP